MKNNTKKLKLLYALQATGNGHISRACELIPIFKKYADVDVLMSGTSAELKVPFEVDYSFKGLSFTFGKNGGIDFLDTFKKVKTKPFIKALLSLPIEEYDIVISDFEPISAWACKLKGKKCIGVSNQEAIKLPTIPRPKHSDKIGDFIIKNYAPTSEGYGFHFLPLAETIFPPLVRSQIRNAVAETKEHYTIYLPAYDQKQLLKFCRHFFYIDWEIFSKHTTTEYQDENMYVRPVNKDAFTESLRTCKGFVCGAGFEAPAEALFLGKKLLIIPMKNQYEQHYNAVGLKAVGATVLKNIKSKRYTKIEEWLKKESPAPIRFEYSAHKLVQTIIRNHYATQKATSKLESLFLPHFEFSH
ncbi:glycosyltransferase family protein [Bernardetia sp. ABR2-2B]|uniref:glycosyltransferase family protein n=1 Tax=Bernardetia sp. ABR2-2B TaxID=3127472 RepID=UPI0030D5E4CC